MVKNVNATVKPLEMGYVLPGRLSTDAEEFAYRTSWPHSDLQEIGFDIERSALARHAHALTAVVCSHKAGF